ncbi:MAG: nitroreductase family deazaflavin-dependent oxidoreductase [Acidobacteria bacterium]|nr:nitroreductase family deazaflavin-dependent oxidoreductase [Acidobacteriota bacterium]
MPAEAQPQYLYLTTTGRRSRLPREIEIWFTEHDGRYYIIAEHGFAANWVQNIVATPQVQVRVAARSFAATARVLEAGADAEKAKVNSTGKYGWGDGLVVEITPVSE